MKHIEGIRDLSERELGVLGMNDLAYIKQVMVDGAKMYTVHAADGTQMAEIADRDIAFAVVRQNDMEPVSVH